MKTFVTVTGLVALSSPLLAGIPVGRGEIFSTVTATTTYDSNVYGSPAAIEDFSATLSPSLNYVRKAGLIEAEVNLGVAFVRYLEETALDAENFFTNATLSIPASEERNYSGSVSAGYVEASDIDNDLNTRVDTQTTTLEARSALVAGPRSDFGLDLSHVDSQRSVASDQQTLNSELTYGYKDFFYGNNLRLAIEYTELQSSGNNALNVPLEQTSYSFTVGLNRLIANDTLRVGVDYGYRILERSAAETASGETRQNGSVFSASIDGPFLPKKYFPKVESRFGIAYQDSATPGINDTGSQDVTGFLSLAWQAREATSVSFAARRSQRLSSNDLSVVSNNIQLRLDQTLRTNLTASLNAGYDWSTFSTVNREDRTSSLGAGLRYQFARSWNANLSYAFTSTTSDTVASEYDRHLVNLSVSYRF